MTTRGVDLVIFDCDGVLVDSERIALRVDAVVCAALGCAFTEAEMIEQFVGASLATFTAAIEARLGRDLAPDWHHEYGHLYKSALEAELTEIDGISAAIARITTPYCVASNGDRVDVERNLRTTGLHHLFAGRVFTAQDVARPKPAPDLFLHAAATMGVAPDRCAVVEDSPFGIEAAHAAGMLVFGYAGGLSSAERLASAAPGTTVFEDMLALPELLGVVGVVDE